VHGRAVAAGLGGKRRHAPVRVQQAVVGLVVTIGASWLQTELG